MAIIVKSIHVKTKQRRFFLNAKRRDICVLCVGVGVGVYREGGCYALLNIF